jgi:hypothetical protein
MKNSTALTNDFFRAFIVSDFPERRTGKLKIIYRQKGLSIMKEMIKAMVQEMVMQSIKEVMGEMLGAPSVTPAEVISDPVKKSYTMEELLALEEDKEVVKHNASLQPLTFICEDFRPDRARNYRKGLKYNKYVSKAVWAYNHIQIREKYPNIKYSNGHYYADSISDLHSFWNMCSLVETLNDEQYAVVKKYWESKKK